MEKGEVNWSEEVEDLVTAGDTQGAISFLENLVSKFQTTSSCSSDDLQLASAYSELASLYSSIGFSLKSDELLSRASVLKERALSSSDVGLAKKGLKEDSLSLPNASSAVKDESLSHGNVERNPGDDGSPRKSSSEDDWEAIADREPDELLASESLPGVSNLSLEDSKVEAPKRRGRGTFSYRKSELYSDRLSEMFAAKDTEEEDLCINSEKKTAETNVEEAAAKYGTRHVLVLADFSPSTRTTDLEKLFVDFNDRVFVIRWVNDTTALAVFRTPSIALEACNRVQCPFTIRVLDAGDKLLGSISARDLEPPRQRPQTSARTAQRLIAQGMGLKLPSTFGSRELRNQEEARRNRIVTRQKLRDDAWGDD